MLLNQKIKLTRDFFDSDPLNMFKKFYPGLSLGRIYLVAAIKNMNGIEGCTKLIDDKSGEIFDIDEFNYLPDAIKPSSHPWCFISSEFDSEYEIDDGS